MNKVTSNREKKEKIVAEISDKVSRAKGLVFTNYQGLTHVQLENIKKAVKSLNAEIVVTKNTLLKLALEKVEKSSSTPSTSSTSSTFEGPTATLFLYGDQIEPLKQLVKAIKELNLPVRNASQPASQAMRGGLGASVAGRPTVKFGILEKQSLTREQLLKLATLPSRDVLIAQLLFQMKAPIYRLHRALSWNMQKLVLTLKEIEKKKN